MPESGHRFFTNTSCRYFPCHSGIAPEGFNCLFCYCPLYLLAECGGSPVRTPAGIKDCTACTRPHLPEAYDGILETLRLAVRVR
jgi:Zn-finger protein